MKQMIFPYLSEIPLEAWSVSAAHWLQARQIRRVVVFEVPMSVRFRSVTSRHGLLVQGPHGWGECAPFSEYEPEEAVTWWNSAIAQATQPGVQPVRDQVPVNVTIPVVEPNLAAQRAFTSGAATAKVKVADPGADPRDDADRVNAVAAALFDRVGARARVRVDVNGAWRKGEALGLIDMLNQAAAPVGGLEYVEQPCASVEELAFVRSRTDVPIAADESIRRASDPLRVVELEAADLAVIKVAPLGGVQAALELARQLPLPLVVSSALDTSIGLAAGVELAAALPDLPYACGLDTARMLSADVTPRTLSSKAGFLSVEEAARIRSGPLTDATQPLPHEDFQRILERGEALIREAAKHE